MFHYSRILHSLPSVKHTKIISVEWNIQSNFMDETYNKIEFMLLDQHKQTKIAIDDETHQTENHSSHWHQVTMLDALYKTEQN